MEIRKVGIAPAFRCILQIIASGKHIWEHFYIGGCIDGVRRRGIVEEMVQGPQINAGKDYIRRLRRLAQIKECNFIDFDKLWE
jgi:hypothetical protein